MQALLSKPTATRWWVRLHATSLLDALLPSGSGVADPSGCHMFG
jgi:hypothetical protein